ncbi:MAG: hypothetical protein FJY92_09440 [Candidatus Hydrogenedentes bacterium]|nr:hypothetical protein [Candidatus Hydrogenedentota bacterium]
MDKPLTPETQLQIHALRDSIAQRDQLGEEVAEELCGHIEDKVIAYLEGQEALTEADALLLAREHFGNPESVRALLLDSRPSAQWRAWLRATVELVTIALAIDTLVRFVRFAAVVLAAYAYDIPDLKPALRWIDNVQTVLAPVILLCVLAAVLRARIRRGQASVLAHLSRKRLAVYSITVLAIWIVFPTVSGQGELVNDARGLREAVLDQVAMLTAAAICATWIAATVRDVGAWRVLAYTALAWALFTWAIEQRFLWPGAFTSVLYDPAREGWVGFPRGTLVFDYQLYSGMLVHQFTGRTVTGAGRLALVLFTLQPCLVKAAVGLLCYLGLGQLGVPGFRRVETHAVHTRTAS